MDQIHDAKPINDNSGVRFHYSGSDSKGRMDRLIPFIPIARKLIQKYSKANWKNLPEHTEFAFVEFQLCTLLEPKDYNLSHRKWKIEQIAWVLEQSPLRLHHDPDLPF